MKISEIKKMNDGVSGLAVEGIISAVYDVVPHEYEGKTFYTQNISLQDMDNTKEFIYVSLSKTELDKSWKGKKVVIDNCKVNEYTNRQGKLQKSLRSSWVPDNKEQKTTREKIEPPAQPVTDWLGKERRELRKTIWDTVFMTLASSFKEYLTGNDLVSKSYFFELVNECAEIGYSFTYLTTPGFMTPLTNEQKEQMKTDSDTPEERIPF